MDVPLPGLQLQRPLFTRHLESVRIVFIGGLKHLHALNADPRAHSEPLAHQTELGHAVQQHVVKLWKEKYVVVWTPKWRHTLPQKYSAKHS